MKMISNINYKAHVVNYSSISHLLVYRKYKPRQCIIKSNSYSVIIFESGKCRIMGCKKPMSGIINCQFLIIQIERIQSVTVTCQLGYTINLYKASQEISCCYEPELFPAMRINKYKPLCVNVFASGKEFSA